MEFVVRALRGWAIPMMIPIPQVWHFIDKKGKYAIRISTAVARQAGVQTSTLRYYEKLGLIPSPKRVSGQRRYDREVLRLLEMIQFAQQTGFTLSEIRTLLHGFSATKPPSARWRVMAQKKIPEVEALIQRAQNMKRLLEEGLHCDCLSLDECIILIRN